MLEKECVIDSIEIRKAEIRDAEKLSKLYNEVYEGKYPLNDFTNISSIEKIIINSKDIWYTAYLGDKCIGSALGVFNKKNNSIEFGRAVISKKYRTSGIGKKLYEFVNEEALNQGIDIIWGELRNKAIYRIAKNLGLHLVGYTELNVVKEREIHFIGQKLTALGKQKRRSSIIKDIYQLGGIKKIIEEMNLEEKEESYPEEIIAQTNVLENSELIDLSYYAPNKALTINSFFNKGIIPEYIQATILVDKIEQITFLKKMDFIITAFLPGWFKKDLLRYDCVLLTKVLVPTFVQDNSLESILKELKEGF
ncbi:MAG: GNAT family N-acetyltransferase [Nanoarchaeota archaeon]|nr:GNAT family N-acetyltransferase [Nanoarchaeota archaeon]